MNIVWLSLQIVLPVLFWSAYHYHKDRHLPEPPANLALCFLLGCAAAGISRLFYEGLGALNLRYDALELGLTDLPGLFAYAMLAIGPIEELAKLLPFLLVVLRLRAFDEPLDGIIYASFIALGYSSIENAYYLQYLTNVEAIARGFAGPLVHIMFASIWGYSIGRAHLQGRSLWQAALISLAIASSLHGIYDFLVLAEPLAALPLSALLMLMIWIWRMLLIRGIHSRSAHEDKCGICEVIAGL
ncbi:MAG: PrsW family intramembrane metalloprotease, partial [Gammaproteobacteria bacterium]|nr:PrsW family intramembrane metalloprotease [Gammaproteobacteria bacterium]